MDKKEYFDLVNNATINEGRVESIEIVYNVRLTTTLKQIISLAGEVDFFDEERRALSYAEILCPMQNIGVDFITKGIIPIIDAYDETYIVYLIETNEWAKYSTVDDIVYKKKMSLKEVV